MTTGVVKWFNGKKGYGFITTEDCENDVFVHFSSINSEGFKTLHDGDEVDFELVDGNKGKEAKNVTVTKAAPARRPRSDGGYNNRSPSREGGRERDGYRDAPRRDGKRRYDQPTRDRW